MTCKTYFLKAFIDFFCWHPIFWSRSSLIRSHRTELSFFLAADFPNFVLIFTEVFIFWAALQHICTFLTSCMFVLLNICHQYCMRARHISLCRETIRAPSFCVCKLYYNFYKSRRAYFPQNIFLQVISFSDSRFSSFWRSLEKFKYQLAKSILNQKFFFDIFHWTSILMPSHQIST